jgi:hypothetical protein
VKAPAKTAGDKFVRGVRTAIPAIKFRKLLSGLSLGEREQTKRSLLCPTSSIKPSLPGDKHFLLKNQKTLFFAAVSGFQPVWEASGFLP